MPSPSPSALLSCPPRFLSTCQAGGGVGAQKGGVSIPGACGRTFLAWVRSQKLPPSRNLSRLSSRLTQHPGVGQLG